MPSLTDLARDDRSARIVLSIVGVPNDAATGRLLGKVGAVELIRLADSEVRIPGMDPVEAALWREHLHTRVSLDLVATLMAEGESFRIITPSDAAWPVALDDLGARAPYALWARGKADVLASNLSDRITITGARAASGYGIYVTEEITGDLARSGRTVVAGGAYGIEGSVHRAALAANGTTIAVLASGIDRAYPVGHADLIDRVAHHGLLISEVPPGYAPTRQRFLDRSRIMAAVSGATVIVEAGARSGTLHTANEANEVGRAVGAVPGPVTSATSNGTNLLLQAGRACVVMNATDVESLLRDQADSARLSPAPWAANRHLAHASALPSRGL